MMRPNGCWNTKSVVEYHYRPLVLFLSAALLIIGTLVWTTGKGFAREEGPLTCPPPDPPSSFWGYVTQDGTPAPARQPLAAWIEGIEVASTTTQTAGNSTYYQMDVPARAYDTVTGQVCRPGGAAGETITFVLDGSLPAVETGIWAGGTLVRRDLTVWSCSPYDFDCDCHIEADDLTMVASHWNCYRGDACYNWNYDLDRDDDVDVVDVMREASRWGCSCGETCYR